MPNSRKKSLDVVANFNKRYVDVVPAIEKWNFDCVPYMQTAETSADANIITKAVEQAIVQYSAFSDITDKN